MQVALVHEDNLLKDYHRAHTTTPKAQIHKEGILYALKRTRRD